MNLWSKLNAIYNPTPPIISHNPNNIIQYDYIELLSYDEKTNQLNLTIKNYLKKPKVTRYVQKDYVKTPIYGDFSEKIKLVKKINKKIFIENFLEEDLLIHGFSKKITQEILDYFSYTPTWERKKQDINNELLKIRSIESDINSVRLKKDRLNNEIFQIQRDLENSKEESISKKWDYQTSLNLQTEEDSILMLILGIITIIILVGFWIIYQYTSESDANNNRQIIQDSKNNMENAQNNYDNLVNMAIQKKKNNLFLIGELDDKISLYKTRINDINQKIISIKNIDYRNLKKSISDDFMDLEKSFIHQSYFKKEIKGVYIIHNQTKNKYYVGQSKDVFNRVLKQHFSNGNVKNIIFAEDWYQKNKFSWKYIECETKDELDTLEMEYIQKYNSFQSGYNKTGGNK